MSRSTEDRKYHLISGDETSPYYQMLHRDNGWQWVWVEEGETEDVGPLVSTRADALIEAADDAENAIDDGDSGPGHRLANRLRLAARAVRS